MYVLSGLDFEGRRRRRHLRLLREAAAATAPGRQVSREQLPERETERKRGGALVTLGGMGFGDWATEERAIDLCFLYASLMGPIWAEHSFVVYFSIWAHLVW